MERIREIPCPSNNEDCPWADRKEGCHLSVHHIYPKRICKSGLEKAFSELPRNKVRSCRNIHDLLDTFPTPAFPPREIMREAVSYNIRKAKDGVE